MNERYDLDGPNSPARRRLLQVGGGLTLAAAFGFDAGAAAQEASPAATDSADSMEGRYLLIRSRTLNTGYAADEVMASIENGFVPLLSALPGFLAYLALADATTNATAFANVFTDKAGAEESTRVGGEWLTDNGYDYFAGDPVVIEGPIAIAAGNLAPGASPATPVAGTENGYAVIRSRKLKADRSADELTEMVRTGFLPIVTAIDGFIAYLVVVNAETRDQFAITVFTDKAGTDASTARAGEWSQQGAGDYVEGDPIVLEGPVAILVTGDEAQ